MEQYEKDWLEALNAGKPYEEVERKYQELAAESESILIEELALNRARIKSAIYDHKKCNKEYAKKEVARVKSKYLPLIEKETDPEKLDNLDTLYKNELRIAKKSRIMNKVQMIFQDPIASLDPRMTVRDIIAEGLIIRGIKDKKYIDEQVYKILDTVGLVAEHATRYPHEFSGGQRQRIGIARAIILNPELIIADEPISALDVSIQAQVINLLNDLSKKMGLTTLFIAHDLAVVKYFSNRIAVMYYGKIVELATSEQLFAHPFHPYTKSLLSAIPLPDPYSEKKRKRITYNPVAAHDYSQEGPSMREVYPGHYVYCNSAEFEKYVEEYKGITK
ncbi:MAG: ATP-binding cassette domain-containing protein [Bacilli bacterium]